MLSATLSFDDRVVLRAKAILAVKGGEGSGNFGHEGRPGEVGGSGSGEGATSFNRKEEQTIRSYMTRAPKLAVGSVVVQEIAARLFQDPEVRKDLAAVRDDPRLPQWYDTSMLSNPITQHDVERDVTAALMGWRSSSASESPASVGMQLATEKEFGLDDVVHPWSDRSQENGEEFNSLGYGSMRDYLGRLARAQYDYTQESLRAAGIDRVSVSRGMFWEAGQEPTWVNDLPSNGDSEIVGAKMQPLSSFTAKQSDAEDFAKYGVLVQASIPRENVFSTAMTGIGSKDEHEVVVLGKTTPIEASRR